MERNLIIIQSLVCCDATIVDSAIHTTNETIKLETLYLSPKHGLRKDAVNYSRVTLSSKLIYLCMTVGTIYK